MNFITVSLYLKYRNGETLLKIKLEQEFFEEMGYSTPISARIAGVK